MSKLKPGNRYTKPETSQHDKNAETVCFVRLSNESHTIPQTVDTRKKQRKQNE